MPLAIVSRYRMMSVTILATALWTLSMLDHGGSTARADETGESIVSLLQDRCFDCHGNGEKEGDLALDELLNATGDPAHYKRWMSVLNNVRAGTMPPPESGKLQRDEVERLASWVKYQVFEINPQQIDPGRVTVRRLNRREYANTIRDLLGVEVNTEIMFPPDDTGFGFDNNGDTLTLSPMLLEKYMAAAGEVVKMAIPLQSRVMPKQSFGSGDFRGDDGRDGGRMFMKDAQRVERKFSVPHDGMYTVDVNLVAHGTFVFCPQRCVAEIRIDGETVNKDEYGWNENKSFQYSFDRAWSAGEHKIEIELSPLPLEEEVDFSESNCDLAVRNVTISGPLDQSKWQHPPRYKDFFTRDDPPRSIEKRREYAAELLNAFAKRAFRRPVDEASVQRLVNIAEATYSDGEHTFEEGIALAMTAVLASPRFLYRSEQPLDDDRDAPFPRVDEYSLASRLSYYLWATMPDERLMRLADEGKLRENLKVELERMLDDRRSMALVRSFGGQWLRSADVEKVQVDALEALGLRKEFDEMLSEFRRRGFRRGDRDAERNNPDLVAKRKRFTELRELSEKLDNDMKLAMRRETEMLLEHIATDNRSWLDVIDPGYTFVNESLADLYGLSGVRGREMRKVELPEDSPRGGILTQGSMLTVTSNPTRTSPVKRGLFVLENILGTPAPPAPPDVPQLEDSAGKFGDKEPTLRELLALHRESALCSSCHSRMDPLGLALEQFNALGMFRTEEDGKPIDASGELITGEKFSDVRELRAIIANDRREDFYRCLTQKMMTFALGRGTDYYDVHTIDQIVDNLNQSEGRYRTLISEIVYSDAFQRQRSPQGSQPVAMSANSTSVAKSIPAE